MPDPSGHGRPALPPGESPHATTPRDTGAASACRPLVLRSGLDIQAVFAGRNAVRGRFVTVHTRRDPDRARPGRVAVVAGRRVGPAVQRNRAKRRLREVLRLEGVPAGFDVVLTAGPDTPAAPFERLRADVRAATARAVRGPRRQPR